MFDLDKKPYTVEGEVIRKKFEKLLIQDAPVSLPYTTFIIQDDGNKYHAFCTKGYNFQPPRRGDRVKVEIKPEAGRGKIFPRVPKDIPIELLQDLSSSRRPWLAYPSANKLDVIKPGLDPDREKLKELPKWVLAKSLEIF